MAEEMKATATTQVDLTKVKPYGDTLNDGIMTKDLVGLVDGVEAKAVLTKDFIAAIRQRLEKKL